MKVDSLSGALLDYWAAKANGGNPEIRGYAPKCWVNLVKFHEKRFAGDSARPYWEGFNPTANWAHAGPLIDKFKLSIVRDGECRFMAFASTGEQSIGATMLEAAMRVVVKLAYGVDVEEMDLPQPPKPAPASSKKTDAEIAAETWAVVQRTYGKIERKKQG